MLATMPVKLYYQVSRLDIREKCRQDHFIFFLYQILLFYSALRSKSKFNLQFCFHKIIILACLEKALISQRMLETDET